MQIFFSFYFQFCSFVMFVIGFYYITETFFSFTTVIIMILLCRLLGNGKNLICFPFYWYMYMRCYFCYVITKCVWMCFFFCWCRFGWSHKAHMPIHLCGKTASTDSIRIVIVTLFSFFSISTINPIEYA